MTGQEQNIYEGIQRHKIQTFVPNRPSVLSAYVTGQNYVKKNFMENVLKFTSSKVTYEKSTNIPC